MIKVMPLVKGFDLEIEGQGHTQWSQINRYVCLSFHDNRTILTDIAKTVSDFENSRPTSAGAAEDEALAGATTDELEVGSEAEATAIPDETVEGHAAPELEPDGTNLDHISIPLSPTNAGDQGNTIRARIESYSESQAGSNGVPIQPEIGQASNSNVDENIRSKWTRKPKKTWVPIGIQTN